MPMPSYEEYQRQWQEQQATNKANFDKLNSYLHEQGSGVQYVPDPSKPGQYLQVQVPTAQQRIQTEQQQLQTEKAAIDLGTEQESKRASILKDVQALSGGQSYDSTQVQDYLSGKTDVTPQPAGPTAAVRKATESSLTTALSGLDSARTNLVTAGGARGLKGYLANIPILGQFIDPRGHAYEATKVDLATQIAKAITGGSRPSAGVIEQYKEALPSVHDTQDVADMKLNNIREQLLNQAKSFGLDTVLSTYGEPAANQSSSLAPSSGWKILGKE